MSTQKEKSPRGKPRAGETQTRGALFSGSSVSHSSAPRKHSDLKAMIAQAARLTTHYERLAEKHAMIYGALSRLLRERYEREAARLPRAPASYPTKRTAPSWQPGIELSQPRGDR